MEIINLFSTPFVFGNYENFEKEREKILNSVYEYKSENPISKIHSNLNGYQSKKRIHTKKDLEEVFNYICFLSNKLCEEMQMKNYSIYVTDSWCNINDTKNSINIEHIHSQTFSGVFYVKIPENSGKLCIKNNSINPLWLLEYNHLFNEKNSYTSECIKIDPTEGMVLIWPSYIPHYVEPNNHDDERISISFNIIVVSENNSDKVK